MIEVEPENTPLSHPGQLMMTTEADMGSNFSPLRGSAFLDDNR